MSIRFTHTGSRLAVAALLTVAHLLVAPQGHAFAAGGSLASGDNTAGSILRGQIDQWTFAADEGDTVLVTVSEVGKDSAFSPALQVFGPDRTSMGANYAPLWARVEFSASQSGTYTAQVSRAGAGVASNDGTGAYSISLVKAPGPFVVPANDDGGTMTDGGNYSGTLLRGDIDPWSFAASENDPVTVSVSEVGKNSNFSPAVQVFGPHGKSVGSNYAPLNARVSFRATEAGTYIAMVTRAGAGVGPNDGAGQYSITLAGAHPAVETAPAAPPALPPTRVPAPAPAPAPPVVALPEPSPEPAPPPVVVPAPQPTPALVVERIVRATDGELYLVQSTYVWHVIPGELSDEALQALAPLAQSDGVLRFPNAEPARLMTAGDGALYLLQSGGSARLNPDSIGDDTLATMALSGELHEAIPVSAIVAA